MKRTLTNLALAGSLILGMSAVPVLAQGPPPPLPVAQGASRWHHHGHSHRSKADRQLKHLTNELKLTPPQQAKIKPILIARDQKLHALMQEKSVPWSQRKKTMSSIYWNSGKKLRAVLTPEQRQKLNEMNKRHRR